MLLEITSFTTFSTKLNYLNQINQIIITYRQKFKRKFYFMIILKVKINIFKNLLFLGYFLLINQNHLFRLPLTDF